jgi:hypothetical protein
MGLGAINNRPGAFGQFGMADRGAGLQSIPVTSATVDLGVSIPVDETVEVSVPAVCLNYGLTPPSPRDTFELKLVEDYTSDVRIRKALRSLASLGTSQGVAQAVMWNVCNNLSFDAMIERPTKVLNVHEVALASRFVEALDADSSDALLEGSQFTEARVFVHISADGTLSSDADRLNRELEGLNLCGLPIRAVTENPPVASGPAIFARVVLGQGREGATHAQVAIDTTTLAGEWTSLGQTSFRDAAAVHVLDGESLARDLDHAIASSFVSIRTARRTPGSTTLKVVNRLPFTVSSLAVRAGDSIGSPSVAYPAVGVGPARTTLITIQAANASVDHVELNGL